MLPSFLVSGLYIAVLQRPGGGTLPGILQYAVLYCTASNDRSDAGPRCIGGQPRIHVPGYMWPRVGRMIMCDLRSSVTYNISLLLAVITAGSNLFYLNFLM